MKDRSLARDEGGAWKTPPTSTRSFCPLSSSRGFLLAEPHLWGSCAGPQGHRIRRKTSEKGSGEGTRHRERPPPPRSLLLDYVSESLGNAKERRGVHWASC